MKQFEYTLTVKEGMHARPAGLFVKEAAKFKSNITITKGDKSVDAKRLFSVMGLGTRQGDTVTLSAEGEDEDTAINILNGFFKKNF
ncbi:MAG: HPr family phosphocarrier protein [Eubacteriales bacterium]